MAEKQTRLTAEQADKFYNEYVTQKSKKFAGEIIDKKVWKNELEFLMNTEKMTSKNWSNTEIREANRLLMREGGWSKKQTEAFVRNITNAAPDSSMEGLKIELMKNFGVSEQGLSKFVRENQGRVYNHLISISEDGLVSSWNEYFNS